MAVAAAQTAMPDDGVESTKPSTLGNDAGRANHRWDKVTLSPKRRHISIQLIQLVVFKQIAFMYHGKRTIQVHMK